MGAAHFTAVKIGDVAGQAEAGRALVVKRRALNRGRLPGGGGVAAGAISAKHRLVFFRFGVADGALLWCAFEFTTDVAAFAACTFVRAGQGKQLGVLGHGKVRHRVQSIVAVEAVGSECLVMLDDEFSVTLAMTVGAGAVLHGVAAFVGVAVGAGQFGIGAANVVVGQGKIGQAVVEVGDGGRFQIIIRAFMFQMAITALFDVG
ncbi:MAG: hypothetical protein CL608_00210 [Anaerolineaceae bacterium]|nr:hypothetical protein [Anaerolineaceae bacterium]